jgi:arylsulfatase A-like enzyme
MLTTLRHITLCLISLQTIGSAESIGYNFNDNDGSVDLNEFGSGVSSSDLSINASGGQSQISQQAEVGARAAGASMQFTVSVDANTTVNLSSLSFKHAFRNTFSTNTLTPNWALEITRSSGGVVSADTLSGSLPSSSSTSYYQESVENLTVTGLESVSNETVSFTFTFTNNEGRDHGALNRVHILDDITLSGTASEISTPSIAEFDADDRSVDPGQTVTLNWQVSGATALSIDQGIGDVTSLTTNGSGSTEVTVGASTSYTLTATNADGSSTSNLPIYLRPSKPNILVILTDDWGTEDGTVNFNLDKDDNPITQVDPTTVGLDAFTQTNNHYHTPTLETLAAQGTIFTRAYVSPMCSPTRVTFMTGQNAARHRTTNYIGGGGSQFNLKSQPNLDLTATNRTLAEVMRDGGYRTIIAGKGHIGNDNLNSVHYKTPSADPADDFYGFQINVSATAKGQHGNCYANASPAFKINGSSASATAFAAEYQDQTYLDLDPVKYANETWKNEPVFVTEALTLEMIERIEDSVDLGKPFFAYMSHFATHQPHQPDPRFTGNAKYAALSGNTLDVATMIEGVDLSTSDIMARLEQLGVAEDTLIVFFGDNGSEVDPGAGGNPTTLGMSNPLRGQKGHRHEGGTRVPFMISWAKTNANNNLQQAFPIIAGSIEHDIVAAQDLYPTLCAAAGLSLPETDDNNAPLVIDGQDLSGYLAGTPGSHRTQKLLIHSPTPHAHDFFSILHQDQWKLIYNYNCSVANFNVEVPLGTYELYNLDIDPYESDNRADSSSPNYDPARVMNMARELISTIDSHQGEYPYLLANDASLASINLPAETGDPHPVILPVIAGVDTDNDSLDDNTEDPNRNGIQDDSETDATNANTDGDNLNDGAELKLGTDPLDQSSFFKTTTGVMPNGSLILTWPSAPGSSFTLQSSSDLSDWTTVVESNIVASASEAFTSYNLGSPSATSLFYLIELEE